VHTHRIFFLLLPLSFLVSAELRVAFHDDGRAWYAVLIFLSVTETSQREKISIPTLAAYSPVVLSLRETMYLRNRLEEILDGDTDDNLPEQEEDSTHEEQEASFGSVPFL